MRLREQIDSSFGISSGKGRMCVIAEYSPEEILSMRGDHYSLFQVGDATFSVLMKSARYRLFAKNLKCVRCGLKGVVMRMEYCYSPKGVPDVHFNLYAIRNGRAILMTKDHIIPKSKGGKDHDGNYQTMCQPCNAKKGSLDEGELPPLVTHKKSRPSSKKRRKLREEAAFLPV